MHTQSSYTITQIINAFRIQNIAALKKNNDSSDEVPPGSTPIYLGENRDLFAWLHRPLEQKFATPVVICNPVGFEYIRTHRAIRYLAESLTAAGFLVVRFDYRGCGDSIGSDRDDGCVSGWLESIATAVQFARDTSASNVVSLIGLRMGATLAYKSTENLPVSNLVLWNPCTAGTTFVREMQIIERASTVGDREEISPSPEVAVDAAGFVMTSETIEDLGRLQPSEVRPSGSPSVFLAERDDLPSSGRMLKWLTDRELNVDVARVPGHREMMLPPQHSIIPDTAIESITKWLRDRSEFAKFESSKNTDAAVIAQSGDLLTSNGVRVRESAGWFGSNQGLFGIVSTSSHDASVDRPAIILLCGGAVHRVSANRMYVPLARRLASIGFTVLRMDISGIGDSPSAPGNAENKPYPGSLCDDVNSAMQMLSDRYSTCRFVLAGLCSGAYAALETAKSSDKVIGLTLINQLVYFMLPKSDDYSGSGGGSSVGADDYPRKNSFFDRLARKVLRQTSSRVSWPSRLLMRRSLGGDLPALLSGLVERKIPIDFVFSAEDPARDALFLFAGKTVNELVKSGAVTVNTIADADHTFSSAPSQDEVLNLVVSNIAARWRS